VSLTTIRQGLQAELQADLGIRMVAGIINAPDDTEDIGCVWVAGLSQRNDVQAEDIEIHARVLLQYKQTEPKLRDPAALEALAESVQTSLRDKQAGQFGMWMYDLTQIEIDLENNFVEATIVATTQNPFAMGG
jgi:hypothetical protein